MKPEIEKTQMAQGVREMLELRKQRGQKELVVYTGDWHDSIPRRLILDPTLTPSEKIIWQVLRTHASQPGENGAWPSVGRLARLAGVSRPTVHNAIDVLQASRWLSVARRVRNQKGAVIGNYYLLHGQPLPIHETMVVTPDYLSTVRNFSKLEGASKKRVREFARRTLQELGQKVKDEQKQVNKLDELVTQMSADLEEGVQSEVVQHLNQAADKMRNTAVESVEKSESNNDKEADAFRWPDSLKEHKKQALALLCHAPVENRQGILDVIAEKSDIRNPLAYLGGLVKKSKEGLFFDQASIQKDKSKEQSGVIDALTKIEAAIKKGHIVKIKGRTVVDINSPLVTLDDRLTGPTVHAFHERLKEEDVEIGEPNAEIP